MGTARKKAVLVRRRMGGQGRTSWLPWAQMPASLSDQCGFPPQCKSKQAQGGRGHGQVLTEAWQSEARKPGREHPDLGISTNRM